MAASTGQTAVPGAAPAPRQSEPAATQDDRPAGERPLVGNQIRWAKQVIAETIQQIRSRRRN
jgi:hypothetical protein